MLSPTKRAAPVAFVNNVMSTEEKQTETATVGSLPINPSMLYASVDSIEKLVVKVRELIAADIDADEKAGREVCKYYYRGEKKFYGQDSDCPTELNCSLYRVNNGESIEKDLYHDAYRLNPEAFVDDKTMVERLTRMQHYSLPTRFADLSSSVLSALYFACEDANQNDEPDELDDGIVRIFKIHPKKMKTFGSDIIAAIAHLPLISSTAFRLDDKSDSTGGLVSSGLYSLAYEMQRERPSFSVEDDETRMRLRSEIQQVWAFEPIWNNERIRFQEGIFLAYGCGDCKKKLDASFSLSDFALPENEDFGNAPPTCGIAEVGKISIQSDFKPTIIKELRKYGILAELIYPDLSDSCKAIARRITKPLVKKDKQEKVESMELEEQDVESGLVEITKRLKELTGFEYGLKQDEETGKLMITRADDESKRVAPRSKTQRNKEFWKKFHEYCDTHGYAIWKDPNEASDRTAYYYTGINVPDAARSFSLHFSYTKASTISLIIFAANANARESLKELREKIEAHLETELKESANWTNQNHDNENGFKRVVYKKDVNKVTPDDKVYEDMIKWMVDLIKGLCDAGVMNIEHIPHGMKWLRKLVK